MPKWEAEIEDIGHAEERGHLRSNRNTACNPPGKQVEPGLVREALHRTHQLLREYPKVVINNRNVPGRPGDPTL
jgi:hypothetical protein